MGDFKLMDLLKSSTTHLTSNSDVNEKNCPICGKPNRCGEKEVINGLKLNRCWCAYETFPKTIFEIIPEDKYRKVCVCQNCLSDYRPENADILKLRKILEEFTTSWQNDPTISWMQIYAVGEKLLAWKTQNKIVGLWKHPPKMITATMDDAVGQGLKIIHLFSRLAGIEIIPLGLLQSKEKIIDACQNQHPNILGMTILQFDTEEILNAIVSQIPETIHVLVGGPIFKMMPENELFRKRYISCNNICDYLNFLLHVEL